MPLTGKQRRHLRALAHELRPVVQIGQRGLGAAAVQQVDTALRDHELIKVKLGSECPLDRRTAGAEMASRTGAELAGTVGRVLILYRPHPEHPRIVLPAGGPSGGPPADTAAEDEENRHGPV